MGDVDDFLGAGRLFLRSEAPGLVFSDDLSTGEFCPRPIPFDRPLGHELEAEWLGAERLWAAVSPHG